VRRRHQLKRWRRHIYIPLPSAFFLFITGLAFSNFVLLFPGLPVPAPLRSRYCHAPDKGSQPNKCGTRPMFRTGIVFETPP
jgi:hypothetical protein